MTDDTDMYLGDIVNIGESVLTALHGMVTALRVANEHNARRADLELRMVNIHIQALELARERVAHL